MTVTAPISPGTPTTGLFVLSRARTTNGIARAPPAIALVVETRRVQCELRLRRTSGLVNSGHPGTRLHHVPLRVGDATRSGDTLMPDRRTRSGPAGASRAPSGVPLDLVEEAESGASRPDALAEVCELGVRDLAERALHSQVGQVQVFLVDDGRNTWIDLDHLLAHELDVEEVLDPELGDDAIGDFHQIRVVQRDEVHRQAGAHRLARLRVTEEHALTVGDPVDRALASE